MKLFFLLITLFISQLLLANNLTRVERWESSIKGCLINMKKVDPKIESKAPIYLICACMATDLINKCAPSDSTPDIHVKNCVKAHSDALKIVIKRCETNVPLKLL